MKDRHELEYPSPGAEFSAPGTEFTPPEREFAPPETPVPSAGGGKTNRRRRKKMKYLAATFLVVAASFSLFRPGAAAPPPAETQAPPPPTNQPSATPAPEPTESVPVPTETPEPQPTPRVYPLGDGTLEITVYSESIDMETLDNRILYQNSFPEAEFTELALPEPEAVEGYSFVCFVMNAGRDEDGQVHYRRLQDVVTAEDVVQIAPGEDGVRHVFIYAAWQSTADAEPWMPLTLDGNGGTPTTRYEAAGPLASGGTVFLCAYPAPERPGYQFVGWYRDPDCSGDPVEALSPHEFFGVDGQGEINWSDSIPMTLYAGWIPEN